MDFRLGIVLLNMLKLYYNLHKNTFPLHSITACADTEGNMAEDTIRHITIVPRGTLHASKSRPLAYRDFAPKRTMFNIIFSFCWIWHAIYTGLSHFRMMHAFGSYV